MAAGEVVEQDWQRVRIEPLTEECLRGIDRRFPPTTASGQRLIGRKLVTAIIGLLEGQRFSFEDGRNLVRTLLLLIFPDAAQNQLSVNPLFWRDDPIGGLLSRAHVTLYGEHGLYAIPEGIERLGIDYPDLTDLLSRNMLALVFANGYRLVRAEVNALMEKGRGSPVRGTDFSSGE